MRALHPVFGSSMIILTLLTFIFLSGCDGIETGAEEIEVELIEAKTELPSKVRLFFRVDLGEEAEFAVLEPSHFEIYEDGSQISRLEAQAQIQRETGEFLFSSLLLLDLSGSILNNADLPRLKEAATSFINRTLPEQEENTYGTQEMAVYWFDGQEEIHPLVFYTPDRDSLISGIQSIDRDISSDVSTNLNGAVVQGLDIMQSRLEEIREGQDISTAGSVVIFTDGTDQAGWVSTDEALEAVSEAGSDNSVFSIGLGGEIDENILSELGRDGFELAQDSLELNEKFLEVARRVENKTNSYYVLEYCSPKRAGEHSLELRAHYNDMVGSFTTGFNAEGFTGGCSID